MKNLIVHPEDPTTTFLSPIYANLKNKTVVRGGIPKSEIPKLIESHDRVLMLGHGEHEDTKKSVYSLVHPDFYNAYRAYIKTVMLHWLFI